MFRSFLSYFPTCLLIQYPNESLTVCYFEYCTVLEQGYFFFVNGIYAVTSGFVIFS